MLKIREQAEVLCGKLSDDCGGVSPFPLFSEEACSFLSDLSALLMKHPQSRIYPDVMTFGFFCRQANLTRMKERYAGQTADRLGRGISFHIAPSNVPINFAYSMAMALLAGNACIVRVSSKPFPQTEIVCGCMRELLGQKYSALAEYVTVIRYAHSREINDALSAVCDLRVIWGGDATVAEVRKSPLPPRASEITFADRFSAAVLDAKAVLSAKPSLARDFFNDTYLYDQNACSSPRLLYWLGDEETCKRAGEYFWGMVHEYLLANYKVEPVISVDKYMAACRLAIAQETQVIPMPDQLISRLRVFALSAELESYRCAGGSFIEYYDTSLDALASVVTRRTQTLSYYGDLAETLRRFVTEHRLSGVDRIVPVGRTADFDALWDGYDLILQMSRCIAVR
ncbi:MAG: hypothetical protein K6F80_04930 [Oscillospiraceae bacterium]|nr:hypothetical protein [Oscillospiraceae bacterium]